MNDDLKIVTAGGLTGIGTYDASTMTIAATSLPMGTSANTISAVDMKYADVAEELMERWIMSRVTVDHKVQEQELLKLKEVAPDYANEIKENLSKNASRDIMKKMAFTKKHDKDADVHHFIGRCWVFTDEELKRFIKEARSA